MRLLRIIIIALILITAGGFIYLTAGSDPETMLFERLMVFDQHHISLILLISVFILLSSPETRNWQVFVIERFILIFALIFIFVRIKQGNSTTGKLIIKE